LGRSSVGSIPATETNQFLKGNIMSCRGYDPKAVKVSKSVKRAAALITDAHARGAFIRSFVEIEKSQSRSFSRKDSAK